MCVRDEAGAERKAHLEGKHVQQLQPVAVAQAAHVYLLGFVVDAHDQLTHNAQLHLRAHTYTEVRLGYMFYMYVRVKRECQAHT